MPAREMKKKKKLSIIKKKQLVLEKKKKKLERCSCLNLPFELLTIICEYMNYYHDGEVFINYLKVIADLLPFEGMKRLKEKCYYKLDGKLFIYSDKDLKWKVECKYGFASSATKYIRGEFFAKVVYLDNEEVNYIMLNNKHVKINNKNENGTFMCSKCPVSNGCNICVRLQSRSFFDQNFNYRVDMEDNRYYSFCPINKKINYCSECGLDCICTFIKAKPSNKILTSQQEHREQSINKCPKFNYLILSSSSVNFFLTVKK